MTQMVYIPPLTMLKQSGNYQHQLMLPHWTKYPEYAEHFHKMLDTRHYIILDNGANEGVSTPIRELVFKANDYVVNELVLPDVMGDFNATYILAQDFLYRWASKLHPSCKLGFVLHGEDTLAVQKNYEYILSNWDFFRHIDVLYIPRMLVTKKEPDARLCVAQYILKVQEGETLGTTHKKEIHFLGASPSYLQEAYKLREWPLRQVRSMDTSAPYVYALNGAYVDVERAISRDHSTYIEAEMRLGQRKMALENCAIMDRWVNA